MIAHDRSGEVVGDRYHIVRLLGRGAMADVYLALDTAGGGEVAVKILRLALASDPEVAARFAREAQVQRMIRHRNVAALYDSGVTRSKEPYLVLELLRGRSLRTLIKGQGPVSAPRAASYIWQTLKGLAVVHAQGILHRDLKPANLMIEPSEGPVERVIVIDFGFASLAGDSRLTQQGTVVGSLNYMAPERMRGEGGDLRSDLYAVGVIWFELLTGRPPFQSEDDMDTIRMHLDEPVPALAQLRPDLGPISVHIDQVIARAMAKLPQQRYANADQMAAAIEQVAQHFTPDMR